MSKAIKTRTRTLLGAIFILTAFLSTVALAAPNPKIYWNVKETGYFGRCNLDGSNVEALSVPGAEDLRRFALHGRRGRIYWGEVFDGIVQTKMVGSARIIISSVPTGSIRGIAVDPNMGKIYWVDLDKIQRANIDGTHIETLYTLDSGLEGIALDLENRYIYVTNWANGKIQRAPMEGGTAELIITTQAAGPEAIALDISNNYMYWTHTGSGVIQRVRIGGSYLVQTQVINLTHPAGLEFDLERRMMYWTDLTKIQRASMDIPFGQTAGTRTDIVDIVKGLSGLNDLHLDLYPETPIGPGFTYQGMLRRDGNVVTGSYDFLFSLWSDPVSNSAGHKLGSTQALTSVDVNDGLFTVILNNEGQFGPDAFVGNARWLQIEVKGPGDAGFSLLSPRQPITPGPYVTNSENGN
ncbi:MAG: hypothetical protein ACYS67_14580 [Planctomycetota bacterium]|jgi:hypothetical protein